MACNGEGNSHDVTLPRVCSQEHTHIRLTAFFPGLPRWAGTKKGKTNLDFTEARDSEWQWNQLGHIQVCTSLQTDNHASTPSLCFLQAGCPSCRPTNIVRALKALCSQETLTWYHPPCDVWLTGLQEHDLQWCHAAQLLSTGNVLCLCTQWRWQFPF